MSKSSNLLYTLASIIFSSACSGCKQSAEPKAEDKTAFTLITHIASGIHFNNTLKEDEDFNIIEYLYFYNGGGVAIGDINNDGLADIYFSSNQESNRLYLNKGNFIFEDITDKAGVAGAGNWKTGVAMADVNGDGLLDIFSCGVGGYKKFTGRNQLYINNGDLTFSEKSEEYGLNFEGLSTHVAFFDYDNDGDLDMYLLNHSVHSIRSHGDASSRYIADRRSGDRLYENKLIPEGRVRFADVTTGAGIFSSQLGYGLGIGISDFNHDGYPDIYVSNDFHENDYLYLNQRDGTFRQAIEKSMPHTSRFSMGNDIADINNDGLPDIITLDMLPYDEGVIKVSAGEDPYDIFQYKLKFGYHYQYARNCLQLNHGVDKYGDVLFSDIAPLAGVDATDWSWSALFADFDNDGYKDLFVANGIMRRPNDLDYINFISSDSVQRFYRDKQIYEQMPAGDVPNVAFKNNQSTGFEDVTRHWLGQRQVLSNGAAYADLDNDGDLDLVVNNLNDFASVYRNDIAATPNSLQVNLVGPSANSFGIGSKVYLYTNEGMQFIEQYLSRGWQSSVDPRLHFGLGLSEGIDSLVVIWPDATAQIIRQPTQASLTVTYDGKHNKVNHLSFTPSVTFLEKVEHSEFTHRENIFNAFASEKLIPHMLSTLGPALAVGDVNNDGNDDFFTGGGSGQPGALFISNNSDGFVRLDQHAFNNDSIFEDVAALFVDVDKDGDLDLFVASGSQENKLSPLRLYRNDGNGQFKRDEQFPDIDVHAACMAAADIDDDGDIDLFVGGRVVPGHYGLSPRSYLLLNDGTGHYTDQTDEWLETSTPGMIAGAAFSDIDQDGRTDLVLVGEWMPVTLLVQEQPGRFVNKTKDFGLEKTHGWWSALAVADFDGDGDDDLVVGNYGLNTRLRPTHGEPIELYTGDLDDNGGVDHFLTYYNGGVKYPFLSRDQLIKQVPQMKRKFLRYADYSTARIEDIIPNEKMTGFVRHRAETFRSLYLSNDEGVFFSIRDLPVQAQAFPIFALLPTDVDGDGILDILGAGNLFAIQPELGRNDAGIGVMLKGKGDGTFEFIPHTVSGFLTRGEVRKIGTLNSADGRKVYLVARNNDKILYFKRR
jgi:enediyne biosynthesis protein E4